MNGWTDLHRHTHAYIFSFFIYSRKVSQITQDAVYKLFLDPRTGRQIEKHTDRQIKMETDISRHRQTCKFTDRQTDPQAY